jgi:uncharacterized membrane protein YfcA
VIDYTAIIYIFLLGSIGGFLSGFLGVGGGIVYVPILDYFLTKLGFTNSDLVNAILANSLFTIIFSGSISSYKQYKLGNFFPREIFYTTITGVVSAVGMTLLIRAGQWYSKEVFSYFFAGMLLFIALRMFMAKPSTQGNVQEAKALGFSITGFIAGIITALSGLGGGVVMTPVFTDVLKQDIKKASSISNGVIPFFAVAVGILNLTSVPNHIASDWQIGYIVFPVVLPMVAAALLFAPMGVMASQKATANVIRITFATFVSLVFIKTLFSILVQ